MKTCIKCSKKTKIIDSRGAGIVKGITCLVRRRVECTACGERFTTYEISAAELDRLASALEVVYKTIPALMNKIRELNKDK